MRKLVETPRKPQEARKTRRENLWIREMLDKPIVTADLNYNVDYLIAKTARARITLQLTRSTRHIPSSSS